MNRYTVIMTNEPRWYHRVAGRFYPLMVWLSKRGIVIGR